ncbi:endonuclease/exonuclease/phosphatase family protein [Streptomyces sp. V2I9]|uniref:endonuclease/exonuclease/phosphatase family protein n=1 Tax=Streptomyces sp. V2I9 TaxID=3042304 RepID=UPI002785A4F8|nr:endonuclease/exonuclease/phosphatase family protein [Streptomyces sp. V2I9]MDQ0985521.1 endonuclease/exonuclease/phosphatase family metal-dependent hydrolase [Streptomyces sp. V2I9]
MSPRRRPPHTPQLLLAAALLGALLAPPAAAVTPYRPSSGGGVPLRVATYNIHAGAGSDGVFDLDRQTAELRSLDADVIGLQEVDRHWGARSAWRDLAGELARRLRMHVSFAPIYSLDPARPGAPRAEYGVAVLSRHRIVSAENHEITRLSTQHPNPVPAPAPGFGEVVVRVRGLPVHVYVTHLDYRPNPAVRVAQVADTRRIMAEDRGPKILLGDLNAEPAAPELAPLWRELTDADPAAPTFPAQDPVKRIDFVAVSKGDRGDRTDQGDHGGSPYGGREAPVRGTITVRKAWVPESVASDHRPVVADLVVRPRGR